MAPDGPGQSSLLFLEVLSILHKKHIPYAVIGAFAASVYGNIRASLDVDAVIPSTRLNHLSESLMEAFRDAGFKVAGRKGGMDDPIPAMIKITDQYENQVDLLQGIRGMNQDVFQRTREVPFRDHVVKVIGLEDFIATKLYAGSSKDLHDAREVYEMNKEQIDQKLLSRVTNGYGSEAKKKLSDLVS